MLFMMNFGWDFVVDETRPVFACVLLEKVFLSFIKSLCFATVIFSECPEQLFDARRYSIY